MNVLAMVNIRNIPSFAVWVGCLTKNSDQKYLSNKIGPLTCCNLQMMIIKGLDETHIINTEC